MNKELNWHISPFPFNPEFREGLGEAVSKAHQKWCDENPDVTRDERAKAYQNTYNKLLPNFQNVKEKHDSTKKK